IQQEYINQTLYLSYQKLTTFYLYEAYFDKEKDKKDYIIV
ncbi:27949_t:CDS:1, partial [Racocetra persica]